MESILTHSKHNRIDRICQCPLCIYHCLQKLSPFFILLEYENRMETDIMSCLPSLSNKALMSLSLILAYFFGLEVGQAPACRPLGCSSEHNSSHQKGCMCFTLSAPCLALHLCRTGFYLSFGSCLNTSVSEETSLASHFKEVPHSPSHCLQ